MTNPIPWIILVAKAIDSAIDTAQALGFDLPGADEVERLKAEVNAGAAKLLPASVIALDLAVQLAAATASRRIASLGDDPRCPLCRDVARQVGEGDTLTLSCDKGHWFEVRPR